MKFVMAPAIGTRRRFMIHDHQPQTNESFDHDTFTFRGVLFTARCGKTTTVGKTPHFLVHLLGKPPPFTARCGSVHPAAPWPGLSSSILHSRRAWLETCARGDRTPGGVLSLFWGFPVPICSETLKGDITKQDHSMQVVKEPWEMIIFFAVT